MEQQELKGDENMWDGDIIENFDLQKLDSVEDLEKEINNIEKNEYKLVPVPL